MKSISIPAILHLSCDPPHASRKGTLLSSASKFFDTDMQSIISIWLAAPQGGRRSLTASSRAIYFVSRLKTAPAILKIRTLGDLGGEEESSYSTVLQLAPALLLLSPSSKLPKLYPKFSLWVAYRRRRR
ncbi:uncharacterized protein F5891DRAFT_1195208 [Suillus fuscotomentosus]|uniref:Uncharacterized protein n=1 Tax=Suillus fuscotomentosus TaxID=1912939 RepID=A0AAD4HFC0_9AGAM|nr:uncharacterized protein F5891DRAFT_1195208 [Suillus fuscotomentosus]KAG1894508.1 hypothetical protein F5891DRAFT_1195208 [Suillus fuscotomentosus]